MKFKPHHRIACAYASCALLAASAHAAGLQLHVPKNWSQKQDGSTITIAGPESAGTALSMKITVIPLHGKPLDDDQLRKLAENIGHQYVGTSVEQKIDLKPVTGDHAKGYTFTLTDANPKPGDAACVSPVVAKVDDVMLAVTILHAKNSTALATAIGIVRGASAGGAPVAASQPAAVPNVLRIPSPDSKWAVLVDLPGVVAVTPDSGNDGKTSHLMTTAEGGLIVSAFVEPAARPGNALAARIFYWTKERKAPMTFTAVKMTGDKDLALLDYTADDTDRNAHAYLSHNGAWVDIHLSKIDGTSADVAAMDKALKSARIEAAKP